MIRKILCWILGHQWWRYDPYWVEDGVKKSRRMYRCHRCLEDRWDFLETKNG